MRQNQVQKSTENREAAFRHEWKHMVGYGDLLALRSRLTAVMARDRHGVDGRYAVRSLYFDNLRDKALREKLDGVDCREKFRVRYYNGDLSLLLLEKKSKLHGLCRKEQTQLTLTRPGPCPLGSFGPRRAAVIPCCGSCAIRWRPRASGPGPLWITPGRPMSVRRGMSG